MAGFGDFSSHPGENGDMLMRTAIPVNLKATTSADHDSTAVIASFSNGVWQTNRSENAHVCIPDAVVNGAPRVECSILAENGSIYAKADPS
ncbi:MAG: hypothetical protein WA268_13275 [Xanthobacteraceae bacterium]